MSSFRYFIGNNVYNPVLYGGGHFLMCSVEGLHSKVDYDLNPFTVPVDKHLGRSAFMI